MRIFILTLITLAMISCGVAQESSSLRQELENNYLNVITMQGSSNTSGQGADFTFEQRLEHHLITNNKQALESVKSKKIFASIDYLFPTNLPAYYDSKVSSEEVEKVAIDKLEALVAENYDYYVLVNSLDLKTLPENLLGLKQRANESRFAPIKTIYQALTANTSQQKNLSAVNRAYAAIAAKYPNVILVDLNDTFVEPILTEGTFKVADAKWNQYTEQNLTSAFISDNVHLNNLGQALFFNQSVLPGLRQIPGLNEVKPMTMNLNTTEEWRSSVSSLFFDSSSTSFLEFSNGTFKIQGTDKNQLSSSNASLNNLSGAVSASAKEAVKSINTVTYVIEKVMAANEPPPISMKLSNKEDGRKVIGLDLDKLFKYTWTDLVETEKGTGEFTAFGSDYFTSANKNSFTQNLLSASGVSLSASKLLEYNAHYWYFFKAKANPHNPKVVDVDWYLIPPFEHEGTEITPPNGKRVLGAEVLEQKLIEQVLDGSIATPYVKYTISLEMK